MGGEFGQESLCKGFRVRRLVQHMRTTGSAAAKPLYAMNVHAWDSLKHRDDRFGVANPIVVCAGQM